MILRVQERHLILASVRVSCLALWLFGAAVGCGDRSRELLDPPLESDVPWPEALALHLKAPDGLVRAPQDDKKLIAWLDASPRQHDVSQSTPGAQPHVSGWRETGEAVAAFAGMEQLTLAEPNLGDATGVSVFVVAQPQTGGDGGELLLLSGNDGRSPWSLGFAGDSGVAYVDRGDLNEIPGPLAPGKPVLLAAHHGTGLRIVVNTVQMHTAGSAFFQGRRRSVTVGRHLEGQIAELLVYEPMLDPQKAEVVNAYLSARWKCCSP